MENSDNDQELQRGLRTPVEDAGYALYCAREFFIEVTDSYITKNPNADWGEVADPESFFETYLFGGAWANPNTDGDKLIDKIGLGRDGKEIFSSEILLNVMSVVVAYVVQAMKAAENDKQHLAWTYTVDAHLWAGILQTSWVLRKSEENPAKLLAKKRHAENYSLINDALKHWRENVDPNLSAAKAANELMRVVPLSHKKLAEVISAEKKRLS